MKAFWRGLHLSPITNIVKVCKRQLLIKIVMKTIDTVNSLQHDNLTLYHTILTFNNPVKEPF